MVQGRPGFSVLYKVQVLAAMKCFERCGGIFIRCCVYALQSRVFASSFLATDSCMRISLPTYRDLSFARIAQS